MPSSLDDSLAPWVALRDPATGDRAREQLREALCRHYWPLLAVTAERLLKEEGLDPRLSCEDYAEAALPALVVAVNGYDPERRGHHGRRLQPRNWIIQLVRQAMKAYSEREGHRLSLLAEAQVVELDDGEMLVVDLAAAPEVDLVERTALAVALSRLPWLQRRAVRGYYVEGKSLPEVAAELRIPLPALRRHVVPRARQKIAWALGKSAGGDFGDKTFFGRPSPRCYRGGRMAGKHYTERVNYRDTPEAYADLAQLAEARGVSVAELLRQLAREAVRKEKARKEVPPAEAPPTGAG